MATTPVTDPKSRLFMEYVHDSFDAAATAFALNPSSTNWNDLKVAMWAWQHAYGMSPEQVSDAAHESLIAIAETGKGDRDFEEG